MADRPIIFSAPMVRALLDGRKTQTRRVLRVPKPFVATDENIEIQLATGAIVPQYATGDRLWVRESWTARMTHGWTIADARSRMFQEEILYRADGAESIDGWCPSIHMPRWASRLTLTITDVRVQRLQEMEGQHPSESDAIAEGVHAIHHGDGDYYYSAFRDEPHAKNWCDPSDAFRELWNSLHGPEAWTANPWIVALTFTVERQNIDAKTQETES